MKPALYLLSLISVIAVARATDCTAGLDYCGGTLEGLGGPYKQQIRQHLWDHFGTLAEANALYKNYLFTCEGGEGGMIVLKEKCQVPTYFCEDAGHGKSDYCVTD